MITHVQAQAIATSQCEQLIKQSKQQTRITTRQEEINTFIFLALDAIARQGAIHKLTNNVLTKHLDRQEDPQAPNTTSLQYLLDYVRHHGPRGPIQGWATMLNPIEQRKMMGVMGFPGRGEDT